MSPYPITRRTALALGLTAPFAAPFAARADRPTEITWDDLIPPGVPYSEIIGEGDLDERNDTWAPIFDENATKLNDALDGSYVKIPGYIVPFDLDAEGITDFVLVPYFGACIHVPPPPPNQLVLVKAQTPWSAEKSWDAVWVTGIMSTALQDTDIAQTGYFLNADNIELYQWE